MMSARLESETKAGVRQYVGGWNRHDEIEFLVVRYCWAKSTTSSIRTWSYLADVAINPETGCIFVLLDGGILMLTEWGDVIGTIGRRALYCVRAIKFHRRLRCIVGITMRSHLVTIDAAGDMETRFVPSHTASHSCFAIDDVTDETFVAKDGLLRVLDMDFRLVCQWRCPSGPSIHIGVEPTRGDGVVWCDSYHDGVGPRTSDCFTTRGEILRSAIGVGAPHPTWPVLWRHKGGPKSILEFHDWSHKVVHTDTVSDGTVFKVVALADGRHVFLSRLLQSLLVQESSYAQ